MSLCCITTCFKLSPHYKAPILKCFISFNNARACEVTDHYKLVLPHPSGFFFLSSLLCMTVLAHVATGMTYVSIKVISHYDMMQYSQYIVNITHTVLNAFFGLCQLPLIIGLDVTKTTFYVTVIWFKVDKPVQNFFFFFSFSSLNYFTDIFNSEPWTILLIINFQIDIISWVRCEISHLFVFLKKNSNVWM